MKLDKLTPRDAFVLLYHRTSLALVMSGASLAFSVYLLWERLP